MVLPRLAGGGGVGASRGQTRPGIQWRRGRAKSLRALPVPFRAAFVRGYKPAPADDPGPARGLQAMIEPNARPLLSL